MIDDLSIPIDRVTYRDGQRLTAQDLRDDLYRTLRRLRLHMCGLHDTWGIALGLEVSRAGADDARGPGLLVAPGYAVDALGRDLIVGEPRFVPIPTAADEALVLTMRHLEDTAFRGRANLASVCIGSGLADPRTERPAFQWRHQSQVDFGNEIPLTQLWPGAAPLDSRVRRYARALAPPYIAWGETPPGTTAWRYEDDQASPHFGLYVDVDTSVAGFNDSPYYFAQLSGSAIATTEDAADDGEAAGQASAHFSNRYGYLSALDEKGFRFRVSPSPCPESRLSPSVGAAANNPPACKPATEANRLGWHVFWIGIEPMAGCEACHE